MKIEDNTRTELVLRVYQDAVNELDDYFEYRSRSIEDREFVHAVLGALTKKIESILN